MKFCSLVHLLDTCKYSVIFSYLYITSAQSTSFRFTISPDYLYQKDERAAVLGDPQIRKFPVRFSVGNVISVTTYPLSGFPFLHHSVFRLKGFLNGTEILIVCRDIVWKFSERETGYSNRDINP